MSTSRLSFAVTAVALAVFKPGGHLRPHRATDEFRREAWS